ncbi:hypothetical protein HYH02_012380 [Chlamydomonas schloesseri]|uniref:Uncharacterized protein n=1 Tax=Chlamydomonas schloesseri TaxID=2026947 RepID=A0A835W056_9CHLO|nr:hypothetical protein HYH02_012380 [Chlamydomonas schloesseri]|eukprot:KAG2434365.1 hypothetical protein HYH02_012380 [Chlamydomonas schloesseri]
MNLKGLEAGLIRSGMLASTSQRPFTSCQVLVAGPAASRWACRRLAGGLSAPTCPHLLAAHSPPACATSASASASTATAPTCSRNPSQAAGWLGLGRCSPVLRRAVQAGAQRRGGGGGSGGKWDSDDDVEEDLGGLRFSKHRGMWRLQYKKYEAEVREDEAWKLAVPLLGGLVLATSLIGPLIIGVAFTAVTVGAALSAGALFTSLFLPFFLLIGLGALFWGGVTFSAFATLGAALIIKPLMSLMVAGAGLGIGALAVGAFLKPASSRAKAAYEDKAAKASKANQQQRQQQGDVIEVEPEVDPEVDRQLREFDELLADREQQRRKTDRFRQGGR